MCRESSLKPLDSLWGALGLSLAAFWVLCAHLINPLDFFELFLNSRWTALGLLLGLFGASPFRMTAQRVPKPISGVLGSTFCKSIYFVKDMRTCVKPLIVLRT